MTKLIVVLGATGGQGGSVVTNFLATPGWRVRGLTRNASSDKAASLRARGVEVVEANTDNQASLERAFEGANAIFAVTNYYDYFFELGPEKSIARETAQGCNIARAAAKTASSSSSSGTLERFVWSTLPNTELFTQGAAVVPHFQGKANVDVYIKSQLPELYAKTTFAVFTIFGVNLFYPAPPETPYPSIGDHRINSGIFVHAVITTPTPPAAGTYVHCNVEDLTLESYLAACGRASGLSPEPGSTVVVQVSMEQYCTLWPGMGEEQASQWRFFGYVNQAGIDLMNVPGFPVVSAQEIMSEEAKKALVGTEESLARMDWSAFGEGY
ncbi:hypothetical protein BJX66DRAFT_336667 [Aspergillus keveii]|uniref:NmrA-like domain-containing protein n=1 Tax=Aspergillus keveii TaxID=714993 RepID=A0ABR4G9Q3_9EURO